MQDLRLVGVHDDGGHLLLSGAGGEMFRLPIDEALRVAASRTPAQVAARAGTPAVTMSPRDIQARIRSGASAAEVAELSGLPLANVQRYEGPVLAERGYVAEQARKVEVATPLPGHDAYRAAFGDNPATLGEMVAHRLTAHGIDPSTVEWDSWRRTDGSWTVVARFETNPAAPATIGEEPPAMWTFSPARKSLHNANRWAQQLSELEPLDGPVPARRLSAVSDRPFDVEADGNGARAGHNSGARDGSGVREADGLLDMLRSRRGQRLGVDEDGDDALALLLTNGVPAAHPRPSEVAAALRDGTLPGPDVAEEDMQTTSDEAGASQEDPGEERRAGGPDQETATGARHNLFERTRDGRPSILSRLSQLPRHQEDDSLRLHDGVSTDTREITVVPAPLRVVSPFRAGGPAKPHGLAGPDGMAEPQAEALPGADEPAPQRSGLDELIGGASGNDSRRRSASFRDPVSRAGVNRGHQPEQAAGTSLSRGADGTAATPSPGNGGTSGEETTVERQPSRPKRSSIPSWDEIVFGTRGD